MNRFFSLYKNELYRTVRKPIFYILLVGIALSVLFTSVPVYFSNTEYISDSYYYYYTEEDLKWQKQEADRQTTFFESNPNEENAVNAASCLASYYQTEFIVNNKEILEDEEAPYFIQECAVDKFNEYIYNREYARLMMKVENSEIFFEKDSFEKQHERYSSLIGELKDAVTNKSYSQYINVLIKEVSLDPEFSDDEKETLRKRYQSMLKANPDGNISTYSVESLITEIETAEKSLKDSINYVFDSSLNKPLTDSDRKKTENLLAVDRYTLENGLLNENSDTNNQTGYIYRNSVTIGSIVLAFMVLVFAGSSVSQEMSTGSIKSLIIAPAKRSKILTAKLASLLTVALMGFAVMFVTAISVNLILFGGSAFRNYVYVLGGSVHSLNGFTFLLCSALIDFIDIIFLLLFALMLSTLTRNTAVAVGGSVSLLFANTVIGETLTNYDAYAVRFTPFANLGLSERVFEFQNYAEISAQNDDISLAFSFGYIIVACVCMLWTTYDSFCRRDIK